jgi:hypothetical protein
MLRICCGLLCLLLVGCNDIFATATTQQDLAGCEVEAIKVYPNWRSVASNMSLSGVSGVGGAADMGDLTLLCMMAKG